MTPAGNRAIPTIPVVTAIARRWKPQAKERWLEARQRELLATPYFHVVFTLPHQLNALAQGNPRLIYRSLFDAASQTLLEFGANPRWLGGQLGATLILHTWGQTLTQHIRMCTPWSRAAHLPPPGKRHYAERGFLFPVKALSPVFRAKYLAALSHAFEHDQIQLAGGTEILSDPHQRQALLDELHAQPWIVYAKSPMAGPAQVLQYLSRYAHRVALSNERLLSMDERCVRFRYKDYARARRIRVMSLESQEFVSPLPRACAAAPLRANPSLRLARQSRQTARARTMSSGARPTATRTSAGSGARECVLVARSRHRPAHLHALRPRAYALGASLARPSSARTRSATPRRGVTLNGTLPMTDGPRPHRSPRRLSLGRQLTPYPPCAIVTVDSRTTNPARYHRPCSQPPPRSISPAALRVSRRLFTPQVLYR